MKIGLQKAFLTERTPSKAIIAAGINAVFGKQTAYSA